MVAALRRYECRILLALIVVIGIGAGAPEAATLRVASNGLDSPTCGPIAEPCRSINQAIDATVGDLRKRTSVYITSAKTGEKVEEAFVDLTRQMLGVAPTAE